MSPADDSTITLSVWLLMIDPDELWLIVVNPLILVVVAEADSSTSGSGDPETEWYR